MSKKLNFNKVHIRTAVDIRDFVDENKPHEEPTTLEEALDMWLNWNGIVGYTEQILRVIEDLKAAEEEK